MTALHRPGVLEIEVRDEFSQLTPARLHIEDEAGDAWQPGPQDRDELMLAGDKRALILYTDMATHFGHRVNKDMCCRHLTTGQAAFRLAPGKYKVFILHGFEYQMERMHVEVKSGEVARAEFKLKRIWNLPKEGWFGGDIHVHIGRRCIQENALWIKVMQAEQIFAINTMNFKHTEGFIESEQYAYGDEGTHQHGQYIISPGEEFRDNDLYGHTTLAGLTEVIQPVSTGPLIGQRESYPLYKHVFEEAQRQGGISGWAHGGISGPLGGTNNYESVPVEAAFGLIDFIEVIGFTQFLGFAHWYALLNAGLQITAAGGSDFPYGIWLAPWHPSIGSDRTYVLTGEPYNYGNWLEGIRRGNTFATTGPLMQVTVNGHLPGETVHWKDARQEVVVRAHVECLHPMECLEVIINAVPVKCVEAKGDRRSIDYEGVFAIDESSWVAVRCRGRVAAVEFGGRDEWHLNAHSTPVYFLRADAPVRVPLDLARIIDYLRLMRWNYLRLGKFDTEEHKQEMLANVDYAIKFYEQRLFG